VLTTFGGVGSNLGASSGVVADVGRDEGVAVSSYAGAGISSCEVCPLSSDLLTSFEDLTVCLDSLMKSFS